MHIGFLFNHYGGHQVAHALPVALALLRRGTNAKVSVLVSEDCESEVRRLASATPGPGRGPCAGPAGDCLATRSWPRHRGAAIW